VEDIRKGKGKGMEEGERGKRGKREIRRTEKDSEDITGDLEE